MINHEYHVMKIYERPMPFYESEHVYLSRYDWSAWEAFVNDYGPTRNHYELWRIDGVSNHGLGYVCRRIGVI